ncbi:uncharacterized protein [Dendrobates tinctorius]|uniref:uncharacterized protein isoform X3 n=1 Tax=Dendrobates tinctorius TaxID=92724 RepID=UPI003CC9D1EF
MAPAGDSKYSTEAMAETFYLSNIVPQNYKNNAGFWNRFEMYCRDLTQRFDDIWIVSGPLLLPVQNEDGKKSVTYQFMSENLVRRMSRMTLEEEYKEYKEFLLELWRVSIELWEVEFEKNKFGGASRAPTLETILHKHKWWMPKCYRRKNQTTIKNISKSNKKETERRPTNWLLRAFTCCFSRAGTQ